MTWWLWLLLGLIAGVNAGIVIAGLLRAAAAWLDEDMPC